MRTRRPHPVLLGLLLVAVAWGSVMAARRTARPGGRWVGYTECAWIGPPRITIRPGLRPIDSLATFAHESVHAVQCAELGPVRYRWRTLFARSNLALETPAYCAGARARTRATADTNFERMTIPLDMMAAMADAVDSATIMRSLVTSCREFIVRP